MEKIETLSTLKGRKFLRNIFFELRFVKNFSSLSSLYIAWKVCCFEKNINKYLNNDSVILHPLGFWRGTFLWMEEIVNRYYYSSINIQNIKYINNYWNLYYRQIVGWLGGLGQRRCGHQVQLLCRARPPRRLGHERVHSARELHTDRRRRGLSGHTSSAQKRFVQILVDNSFLNDI